MIITKDLEHWYAKSGFDCIEIIQHYNYCVVLYDMKNRPYKNKNKWWDLFNTNRPELIKRIPKS